MATTEKTQVAVVNNKFIDTLVGQLNEKQKAGFTFPKDYSISKELTAAYLILKETEDKNHKPLVEACSSTSIANSLLDMATLGLSAQRKQGYFIAYGGKCSFQRSYFGNMALARRCGMKEIHAEVIYDGDDFQYDISYGVKRILKHTQKLENINPDKIIGAYAVVTLDDGATFSEVMNIDQIKKAWSQGYGYKEGAGTHGKFPDQMAKKTVINRALKGIVNSSPEGWMSATESYDNSEDVNAEDVIDAEITEEGYHETIEMPSESAEPTQMSLGDIKATNPPQTDAKACSEAKMGF